VTDEIYSQMAQAVIDGEDDTAAVLAQKGLDMASLRPTSSTRASSRASRRSATSSAKASSSCPSWSRGPRP